ncbi:uncharacterized protein LOC111484506 [Cucurbita maxima]|uniref:Uncharacterized protein LOC111484506 n=1 Tax=Cucurbita maxima TaxID=3661 RepID=A0A6J1JHW9_CUCMA|nr:uncharacterized protein LOC111484506 [Cucurbita maxima]
MLHSSLHIEQAGETMEDVGCLWRFQENVEDLKQKLLQTTIELESLKMEANEESIKNKEKVKSLLLLLQAAYEERDEARDQLQKLMNKFMPTAATELPALLHFHPESPLNIPTKANSSITESNSLYETYNHQSYGSSPADSFFDGVSSPDFSTPNMADSSKISFLAQPMATEYNAAPQPPLDTPKTDKADLFSTVMDNLVKGRTLPQKGNLLQAVTEAGPLLQTLLVAGPLPQWCNPPPLQAFKIPPLLVNGCINLHSKPSSPSPKPLHSLLHPEMSRGSSQICASSGSCFNSAWLMAPNGNAQILSAKRQKIQ